MQQLEPRSDRWISIALSVALHGALIAALVYGWLLFRKESRPAPSLAINATVVSSQALSGSGTVAQAPPRAPPHKALPPKPLPPPPPPPQPPPQPTVDEQTVPPPPDMAARQEAARKAAQAAAEKQAEQAQADAERKAQEAAQRKEAEEEAKRKARQQAELEAQAEAKRKAKAAEEAKKRELAAEQQRRAEEAKALALNQADLQQSVEAEEKAMAARSGPALATWEQLIRARIEHAWIRPPTARQGIDCLVDVTQVPGGQVVNVKVGACNGDTAVVQSIQDAAYRASPLPPPPDPALFERDLQIEFKPTD